MATAGGLLGAPSTSRANGRISTLSGERIARPLAVTGFRGGRDFGRFRSIEAEEPTNPTTPARPRVGVLAGDGVGVVGASNGGLTVPGR